MTDTRHPQIEFLKREDRRTLTQTHACAHTQGREVVLFSLQEQGTNEYTNERIVNYGTFHSEACWCLITVGGKKERLCSLLLVLQSPLPHQFYNSAELFRTLSQYFLACFFFCHHFARHVFSHIYFMCVNKWQSYTIWRSRALLFPLRSVLQFFHSAVKKRNLFKACMWINTHSIRISNNCNVQRTSSRASTCRRLFLFILKLVMNSTRESDAHICQRTASSVCTCAFLYFCVCAYGIVYVLHGGYILSLTCAQ